MSSAESEDGREHMAVVKRAIEPLDKCLEPWFLQLTTNQNYVIMPVQNSAIKTYEKQKSEFRSQISFNYEIYTKPNQKLS